MIKIKKDGPTSSDVHVNVPLGSGSNKKKGKITITSKSGTTIIVDEDIDETDEKNPPLNNIGKSEIDEDPVDKQPARGALFDMQDVIEGMDWELAYVTKDTDLAQENAISELEQDPEYYKKIKQGPKPESLIDNNAPSLNVDLGSGIAREPGHIGFDTYPYDHGTIVHDLNEGIPLSSGSVKKARAVNSMHEVEDPKALLSEIHRVLMPGGQFEYQGPEEIYNYPEWKDDYPGLVMVDHQDNVQKSKNPIYKQTFTRIAVPDAATANDAEPRTGVGQYDQLPADELLAMDAVGYYWSDATTSGKSNRFHGYASQGALADVGKGGPGSGPSSEGGGTKEKVNNKEREVQEHKQKMLSAKTAADRAPSHEKDKKMSVYQSAMNKFNEVKEEFHQAVRDHVSANKHSMVKSKEINVVTNTKNVSKSVKISKADTTKQIVYGVVLAPDEVDFQDDFMTAPDIEASAHQYLIDSRIVGKQHEKKAGADVVESYIAPQDLEFDGQNGPQKVKKGSWIMGVKIIDRSIWEEVLNGEITGFSVGGKGERV